MVKQKRIISFLVISRMFRLITYNFRNGWLMQLSALTILSSSTAIAAPTISSINQQSNVITIAGQYFGAKTTPKPFYYNNLEAEAIGLIPSDQLTNLKRWGTVEINRAYSGSKSLEFDYCAYASGVTPPCSDGSLKEDWRRTVIDLGPGGADKVYVSMWVYIDKGTSTSSAWQWKGPINIVSKTDSNGTVNTGTWYYDSSCTYPGPYPNVQCYQQTSAHTYTWWRESPAGFFNNAATTKYYDDAARTTKLGSATQSRPADAMLWNQWQRLEFYAQKSSSPAKSDGIWREQRIGKSNPNFNYTQEMTHLADNDPWRFVALTHAVASVVDGYVDLKVYMDDVYVDTSQARVEMCDSSTWASRKHCEIQPASSWVDGQVKVNLNSGSFKNGQTVYIYVLDSSGAVNSNGAVFTIGSPAPIPPKNVTATPVN